MRCCNDRALGQINRFVKGRNGIFDEGGVLCWGWWELDKM